jgi:glyoxylase-like metal-dependent hydrolase (beta-lactamase superfamily II)
MDIRVLSIGTLSAHPLWGERTNVRTGHATTTLIRTGDAVILVDPGLPDQVIKARLSERAGIGPDKVTHVFLTSFNPECRRGLGLFDHAPWLISEAERESIGVPLVQSLSRVMQSIEEAKAAGEEAHEDQTSMVEMLQRDIAVLQRTSAAPDTLAPGVDLFPLPGVSAGMCGVLISEATRTTLISGDAVPTREHMHRGQVLGGAHDREQAIASLQEALEIADVLIPGRDNLQIVPNTRPL